MNKLIITSCLAFAALAVAAMSSKKELAQAQKPVEEATKADLAAYKAGQKTAKEVAESHLALAAKAANQAEKYLLYQGAFKLHARSGEYDRAIETLQILKREVKDVTPEVINELVGQELRGVLAQNLDAALKTGSKTAENPNRKEDIISKETVGYTWSYRVKNGEATITGEEGKYRAAVSPYPVGHAAIPSAFGGAKVTCVGVAAFYQCAQMTSVTIPESVTNIEHGAFQSCSGLKSVTIPSGVRNIAKQAFWACEGLETVTMLGERPEVGFNAFEKCGKLKAIHVPANAKSWAGMKEWQGVPLVFDAK